MPHPSVRCFPPVNSWYKHFLKITAKKWAKGGGSGLGGLAYFSAKMMWTRGVNPLILTPLPMWKCGEPLQHVPRGTGVLRELHWTACATWQERLHKLLSSLVETL